MQTQSQDGSLTEPRRPEPLGADPRRPDSRRAALRYGRAPGAWPLVGHVVELLRAPLNFFDSLASYGDLVEIRLGPKPAFVLCHPALAHQVLSDFRTFDRTGLVYDLTRHAMGSGIATAPHADHRRQRLTMQPAFRHEHLHGYVAAMRQEVGTAMDHWTAGDRVDLARELPKVTTTVALRALFSTQLDALDLTELHDVFDTFLHGVYTRVALPVTGRLPTPGNRRYDTALVRWRAQIQDLIDGYRRAGVSRDDLMSRLLRAGDERARGITDKELSDEVGVLLLAGGETTSAAVLWALMLLSEYPMIMEALHAEVDAVADGAVPGWEQLPQLKLTARVVRETLRLYPPAWIIPRTTVTETRLAGRTLPAGSMIIFSPYILHRRPDFFPEPHRFDPDRWLPKSDGAQFDGAQSDGMQFDGAQAPHRGPFLPFGAGATKCIGEDFAFAEATILLAAIVGRWTVTPEPDFTGRPGIRAVLAPKSLPVRLTARHQPSRVAVG